jgi:hypothetical protein
MWWGRSCYISTFPCSLGKSFWWDKSGNFRNTRRKEWRKGKDRYMEVPILVCSPWVGNTLVPTALMQPFLRRTHLCGNLPYNIRSCWPVDRIIQICFSVKSQCFIMWVKGLGFRVSILPHHGIFCSSTGPKSPPSCVRVKWDGISIVPIYQLYRLALALYIDIKDPTRLVWKF